VSVPRRISLPALALLFSTFFGASCASRPAARNASHPVSPSDSSAGWSEEGLASWYGGTDGFEGKPTASGETYDSSKLTAAHRDLPLGTIVDVTNADNGKTVRVRINDRGPFVHGRIIDLSHAAAQEIGIVGPGVGPVQLKIVATGVESEPLSPTGQWAVQVGSFADRSRAERQADKLRAGGYVVYLEPYGGLTRVKVGPVESREEAATQLRGLEAAGFEGIVVPAKS
jgi:peptidoglycan lytic transglycosylase